MPSILASLFSRASTRFFNQTFGIDVLTGVKVVSSITSLDADLMRHMKENGSTEIDSKVVKPIEINMDVICPTTSDLEELNTVLQDRNSIYQITSRGLIFRNMMPRNDIIKQDSKNLSSTPVRITFSQLLVQGESPIVFANQADARTVNRGVSIIGQAADTVSDFYDKVSSYF